ncbi:MAG: HAMP domain-containing histidine kinase [Actinobacteria bacterium]|nr:HAMP domain-containing histidine kinase [Actinomycetota bacterium]
MRIWLKLTLAFVLVAAVAVGVTSLLVGLSTPERVERLAVEFRQADTSSATPDALAPRGPPFGPGHGAGMGRGPMMAASTPQQRFIDETTRSLLIGLGAGVGTALLLGTLMAGNITRPLRRLSAAARRIAAGRRDVHTGMQRRDEIGELGRAVDHMVHALELQESARRNLFADLAHEMRTPLTVIEGNAQAMLDGVYERTAENLSAIVSRARGLHRVVEDIRDLSLADVGQLKIAPEPVDAVQAAEEVVRDLGPAATAKGVSLVARGPAGIALRADPARLRQVLSNLVDNAVRHTPSGGSISVSVDVAGGRGRLEVADTGEGIPTDDLPHVFDRFYRADRSRSRDSGGTGLGLAIVRALVEAMGGVVSVASTPGQGTRFRVELPPVEGNEA